MFDDGLRIFFRPFERFFRRITDLAKDATGLRFGIRHVELIFDQPPDATTRPDRVGVAGLRRASFEKAFEFGELFVVELRRSSRSWLRREGVDALLVENFSPELNGGHPAFENFDNLAIAVALRDQPSALNPAVL